MNKGSKVIIELKKKDFDFDFHFIKRVIQPIAFCNCQSWGDCDKNSKIKVEKFDVMLCKQLLVVRKTANNIQALVELGRFPFKTYIEIEMRTNIYANP